MKVGIGAGLGVPMAVRMGTKMGAGTRVFRVSLGLG